MSCMDWSLKLFYNATRIYTFPIGSEIWIKKILRNVFHYNEFIKFNDNIRDVQSKDEAVVSVKENATYSKHVDNVDRKVSGKWNDWDYNSVIHAKCHI